MTGTKQQPSFQAVLFDLDGTLLDTLEDLADTANQVLAAYGHPTHGTERYRFFVGDGLGTLIERILRPEVRNQDTVARLAQAFRQAYARNWKNKSAPYPGIEAMLRGLRERGLTLCVLSNKPQDFTRLCVRELLPGHEFALVLGQEEGRAKKPDPAGALEIAQRLDIPPRRWLYLGDTNTDMKTATAAGMVPVGVLWGFRPAEELRDSGARHLLKRPEDIFSLL